MPWAADRNGINKSQKERHGQDCRWLNVLIKDIHADPLSSRNTKSVNQRSSADLSVTCHFKTGKPPVKQDRLGCLRQTIPSTSEKLISASTLMALTEKSEVNSTLSVVSIANQIGKQLVRTVYPCEVGLQECATRRTAEVSDKFSDIQRR